MKIKKVFSLLMIIIFLCQGMGFSAPEVSSALRPPMRFGGQVQVNFTDQQMAAFKKLKDDTGFDTSDFLFKGFTHYKIDGHNFLFWLRRGKIAGDAWVRRNDEWHAQQNMSDGFHILIFDCVRKRFVGSIENIIIKDTSRHIIEETEFDDGVFYLQGYPMDKQSYERYASLLGIPAEAVEEADDERLQRLRIGAGKACSIWIMPEYRNPKNAEDEYEGFFGYSGIGQTLTALDEIVAVHLYGASIRTFQGTLSSELFHVRQGARYLMDGTRLFIKKFETGNIDVIKKIHIATPLASMKNVIGDYSVVRTEL